MNQIYDYLDYQEYLRDFYHAKKGENPYFSYRYMGMRLGLDPGFLVKVLQGRMHLSWKSVPKVVTFCQLTGKEADYFELLVRFSRAKNERETKLYFEKLLESRGISANCVEEKQYAFYTKWYHTAIRSLLGYYKFSGNYAALAKKLSPSITAKQAKESIRLLTDLGFIFKNADGVYELKDKVITTGEKWRSAAIRAFQEETIQLARESLDRHPKEARDVSTITVAVSHEDLQEIRERAREFRRSILQMKTNNKQSDVVYQVNVQIVPLTEIGAE